MTLAIGTIRKRIEAQGFTGLSDGEISELNYWFRLAPAICLTWTAVGVAIASPAVLFCLVPFALLGAVLPGHPFDLVYNRLIRHVINRREIPVYGRPRRFACLMASVMISITASVFYLGLPVVGYILGFMMFGMATVNVTTGFCVPSFIYGLVFGKPSCHVRDRGFESGL